MKLTPQEEERIQPPEELHVDPRLPQHNEIRNALQAGFGGSGRIEKEDEESNGFSSIPALKENRF